MAHPVLEKMKALREEAKSSIKSAFKDFFDKHPQVEQIVWTQYAPYFNDGDACIFRVHDFSFVPTAEAAASLGMDDLDDYSDDENDIRGAIGEHAGTTYDIKERKYVYGSKRPLTEAEASLMADADELEELCHQLQDEMKSLFGADGKITATRDGFDVSEYDHN